MHCFEIDLGYDEPIQPQSIAPDFVHIAALSGFQNALM